MVTELAQAYIGIIPSFKGIQGSIAREFAGVEKSATGAGDRLGKNLGNGFSNTFKKIAGPALAVFGAGAIANFAKGAVSGFSELEDSTAAASVVFGDSMQKIMDQSAGASKNLGLTKQQVINAANTFGTYGKAAGLSGDALASFATEQTALAADMASFKGTSPEQAIEAIGAALRGETEPIRAYGVMLDDASLKNEALAQGLISSTKDALSPQNKTLAAQALILKQTADAQGDFARTSDSTANVAKTLSAQTADLSAKVGSVLAPAFTAARTAAIGAVGGVSGILDKVTAFQGALAGGGNTLDLVRAIGLDPSQGFGSVVTEGIGSVRAFGAAWKANDGDVTSSGLPGFMEKLAYSLRQGFEKVIPVVTQLGPPLLALLMAISPVQLVFQALLPVLPQLTSVIGQLAVIAGQLASVIASGLTIALQFLAPVITTLLTGLAGFIGGITSSETGVTLLMTALSAAAGVWLLFQGRILATTIATNAHIVATKAQAIAAKAAAASQWLMNAALTANPIGIVVAAVAALVGGLVYFFTQTETGRKVIETVWGAIKRFIGGVADWFRTSFLPGLQVVFKAVGAVFSWLYNNVVKPVFDGIKWYISVWWTVVSGIFNVVVVLVKNVLGPVFRWFYDNVIKPVWDSVSSKISGIWNDKIRPVFDLLKKGVEALPAAFELAKNGISTAWDAIREAVKKPIRAVVGFINEGLIDKFNIIPGVNIPELKLPPAFAKGGLASPGWAMVGEEGPELVNFSRPGRVYTAKQSAQMLRESSGTHALGAPMRGSEPHIYGPPQMAAKRVGEMRFHGLGGFPMGMVNRAAAAWQGLSGVGVKAVKHLAGGFGANSISVRHGGMANPNWIGYYSGQEVAIKPGGPNEMATLVHEIGHALGLGHNTGNTSVMHPYLGAGGGALWPTPYDQANLQRIYGAPGSGGRTADGSGEAAVPDNPLNGVVDWFTDKLKKAFPEGGMFIDAAGGLAKSGIEQVTKLVSDIKAGIAKVAGDVFGKVKDFFGGGSGQMAPTLYDQGGVLPTNNGRPFLVQNKTRKPEVVHTQGQLAERDAHMRAQGAGVVINGNVGWMPDQVALEIEVRKRRAQTMAGMDGVVFA